MTTHDDHTDSSNRVQAEAAAKSMPPSAYRRMRATWRRLFVAGWLFAGISTPFCAWLFMLEAGAANTFSWNGTTLAMIVFGALGLGWPFLALCLWLLFSAIVGAWSVPAGKRRLRRAAMLATCVALCLHTVLSPAHYSRATAFYFSKSAFEEWLEESHVPRELDWRGGRSVQVGLFDVGGVSRDEVGRVWFDTRPPYLKLDGGRSSEGFVHGPSPEAVLSRHDIHRVHELGDDWYSFYYAREI